MKHKQREQGNGFVTIRPDVGQSHSRKVHAASLLFSHRVGFFVALQVVPGQLGQLDGVAVARRAHLIRVDGGGGTC